MLILYVNDTAEITMLEHYSLDIVELLDNMRQNV